MEKIGFTFFSNLVRDVSVSDYNFLVSSGAGGLLLLLPPQGSRDLATSAVRESIATLEVGVP